MDHFFENKTIAIIGNANSLLSKSFGEEIDSHDIVIRINRGIIVCHNSSYLKSHGRKIDLWCFNIYRSMKIFDEKMTNSLKQDYLKMQMTNSDKHQYDYCIPKELYNQSRDIVNPKKPTTGFRVLYYISQFNLKEVSVYGFDWKSTHTFYRANNSSNKRQDMKDHDYEKERKYCFENYFSTNKMILKS